MIKDQIGRIFIDFSVVQWNVEFHRNCYQVSRDITILCRRLEISRTRADRNPYFDVANHTKVSN